MHLGSRVSALLDGRLPLAEEERAWEHVHECHPCRDLVEREGWVKTRLAGLSLADRSDCEAPDALKSSLLAAGCGSALTPPAFPTATAVRLRHRSLVAIGGGAAGAAVVGVLALGATGTPQLERRAPVGDLSRPTQSATPTIADRSPVRRTPKGQRARRLTEQRALPASQVVMVRDLSRVTMTP